MLSLLILLNKDTNIEMDVNKVLILTLQSKNWVNKTTEISKIVDLGDMYHVRFNTEKTYTYKKNKIQYFNQPHAQDLANYIVRIGGKDESLWDSANIFGPYICLYKNDRYHWEKNDNVQLLPNIAAQKNTKELTQYYHHLSDAIGKKTPYLSLYFKHKLNIIFPESVLNNFINGKSPEANVKDIHPLFPFGINLSQRRAVIHALSNKISLIQGPPGTGKTQTILNIIANLVMEGKTVAVVAGNNSAIDNVYEKLVKEKMGFLVAKLGNEELQKTFFNSRREMPLLSDWLLPNRIRINLKHKLLMISQQINQHLAAHNQLAIVRETLSRLQIEQQYFRRYFAVAPLNLENRSILNKWSTPNLLQFMAEIKYYSRAEKLTWKTKFRWLLKYRIYQFSDLKNLDDQVFKGAIREYYEKKEAELVTEIDTLEHQLAEHNFEQLKELQKSESLKLFKDYVAQNYQHKSANKFDFKNYKKNFPDFLKHFPIVLSTTDSIINNRNNTTLFDYLIVDEASQVDLLKGYLSMSCAKHIVAVGDLKQLPHITDDTLSLQQDTIDSQFSVKQGYSYFQESLLSSLHKIFGANIPSTLLKEHYRCHPRIIDYCNQKFYQGQLVPMTESTTDPFKIVKTAKGNHARRPADNQNGYINVRELDVIENEILPDELDKTHIDELGIITPYRAQANSAQSHLSNKNIEVNTVYKYQGREKETIIFGTTANKITKYIDDPQILNVAVSRAKNRFIMVMSQNTFKHQGSNLGDLIRHVEYQSISPSIFESKTVSIFDCLTGEYSDALSAFLKKVKRRSDFPSEDLMSTLLDKLLKTPKYNSFNYRKNYSLSLLVNDVSILDEREKRFALNPNSHIDFLLYNKLDKQPVLAIEVDGYKYHELNEKQRERDKIKNNILQKLSYLF